MISSSAIYTLFEGKPLSATLNASSAIMKIFLESLSVKDAQTIFCKDDPSRDLFLALTDKIQRDLGESVMTIESPQKDKVICALDSAVTSITQKVTQFNACSARSYLNKLRGVKVDLA